MGLGLGVRVRVRGQGLGLGLGLDVAAARAWVSALRRASISTATLERASGWAATSKPRLSLT